MATYTWRRKLFLQFILICLLISTTYESDEFEGQMSLVVQHSFDSGLNSNFVPRGTISLKSIRNGIANYNGDYILSTEDRNKLKALVKKNGFYRLRILVKNENDARFVSTFIRACSIYESKLVDKISLFLDQYGEVLGVSLITNKMLCDGSSVSDHQLTYFNTSIELRQMENGPTPDIASYIQKVEKDKAERAKEELRDNRSFFTKYWMYIVPVLIFLLVSGAANPEAQGAGGGR